VDAKTPFATFVRTYSYEKGVLTVKRKVVVLESKLPSADWAQYKKFVTKTSLFDDTYIQLLANGKSSASTAKGTSKNNEAAQQLVAEADALEKSHDFKRVMNLLDEAKKIAPKQAYLWSNYGWVAMMKNHLPDALKDFRQELKNHPDESYVSYLYATALARSGQITNAAAVLKPVVEGHPGDSRSVRYFAYLESLQGNTDSSGTIAILRRALKVHPDDGKLASALATFLIRNHEDDKAAPLLEKALASATAQKDLNNGSYQLALTGKDLPLAEAKSREAVKELEAQTAQSQVAAANDAAFRRSANLVSNWGTLGYILMREGKLDAARNYLEVAWDNEQIPVAGLHYGMVLEKLGDRTKALRLYELLLEEVTANVRAIRAYERAKGEKPLMGRAETGLQEDEKKLTVAVARLKREHVHWSSERPWFAALQSARTFHLLAGKTPRKFEQATFRLQFSAEGPPQVIQVNGSAGMAQFVKKIKALHFPEFVPKGSEARLVRDAAMSCSPGDRHCLLVLMPMSRMQAENTSIQK